MELKYIVSESSTPPKEIEIGLTTVYFRRNIYQEQRSYDENEPPVIMYVYEEAKVNKDEALHILTNTVTEMMQTIKTANQSNISNDLKTKILSLNPN